MPTIKPFRAVRPAEEKVPFVVTRSYEEYSMEELETVLASNPFSFLQIINPGYKSDSKVSVAERFNLVHNRFLEFLEERILVKDESEGFYIYKINRGNFSCCGFFCATSVADYRAHVIRRHEDTIIRREILFAKYLKKVRFNTEPVLITYPDNPGIAALLARECQKAPAYQFTTPDGITHTLWPVFDKDVILALQEAFRGMEAMYIADGHHRSASSDRLAHLSEKGNPGHTGEEAYNFFMSYLIPDSEIKIHEFNRMVKDLHGLTKDSFLMCLDENFRIENKGAILYTPSGKHEFSMYLDGEFYALHLRQNVYKFTDVLSKLDTQILLNTVLEPVLGIKDLRNDQRIQYGYGKQNVNRMKDEIDRGNFAVGFGLVPVTVAEIKAIADAGQVMPPKSTYIEPKLRSGLAIYEF